MPIERRDTTTQIRAILIGVVALIFAGTLGYATFRAVSGDSDGVVESQTANQERFNAGVASQVAQRIDEGGPVLYPDPTGNDELRPIYLSHIGDDEDEGWLAFIAKPPEGPPDCFLTWDQTEQYFEADCTDDTFGVDGEGLEMLDVEVTDEGDVIVDVKG